MSLNLGLSDLCSHNYIVVMGLGKIYHTRGIITLSQGFIISTWLLMGFLNLCHLRQSFAMFLTVELLHSACFHIDVSPPARLTIFPLGAGAYLMLFLFVIGPNAMPCFIHSKCFTKIRSLNKSFYFRLVEVFDLNKQKHKIPTH